MLLKPLRREILAHATDAGVGGRHCRRHEAAAAGHQLPRARAGAGRLPQARRTGAQARPRRTALRGQRPGLSCSRRRCWAPWTPRPPTGDRRQGRRRLHADARHAAATGAERIVAAGECVGTPLPLLALDTEFGFSSAADRARFAQALSQAITTVVAEHTTHADRSAEGRYRMVLGCYPDSRMRSHDMSTRTHHGRIIETTIRIKSTPQRVWAGVGRSATDRQLVRRPRRRRRHARATPCNGSSTPSATRWTCRSSKSEPGKTFVTAGDDGPDGMPYLDGDHHHEGRRRDRHASGQLGLLRRSEEGREPTRAPCQVGRTRWPR